MNPGWMAALATLAGLPLALAGPADPQAGTPAPQHRPVFTAPPPDPAPLDWRDANDTVGRFTRGHADLLRWEAAQPAAPTPPPASGEPLALERALALGWSRDLRHFATPGMSPVEQAAAHTRAAEQAHAVRRAWYAAVAAEARQRELETAWNTADAGAELGRRMQRVGNWSAAQAQLERQQRNEAGRDLVRARADALAARERLNSATGLWGAAQGYRLPADLPPPPAQPPAADGLEARALEQHPLLRLLRDHRARIVAGVNPEQLARARQALQTATAELRLDTRALPGWNHALEQALAADTQTDALALQIRSQVREAWLRLRAAHELATVAHAEALALAGQRQQDSQQRYNGMLASTWDLLAASRALNQARGDAIQARLDYWLAHNDLTAVLAGMDYAGPESTARAAGAAPARGH